MPDTLTDLWATAVWLDSLQLPLHQSAVESLLSTPAASPHAPIKAETVIADQIAIEDEFRRAATQANGEPVTIGDLCCQVHLLGPGYSVGLAYGTGDWMGWCVLGSRGTPAESSSGMLSLHDPRAGCAGVDVPGSPWGRPLTIKAQAGIAVLFPGWLGYSITPVEPCHRLLLLTITVNPLPAERQP